VYLRTTETSLEFHAMQYNLNLLIPQLKQKRRNLILPENVLYTIQSTTVLNYDLGFLHAITIFDFIIVFKIFGFKSTVLISVFILTYWTEFGLDVEFPQSFNIISN